MMTCRLILGSVLVLLPFALFAREISKIGFRAWLRESGKQTGFQWLGRYFPRGLKTIGPLIYLLVTILCIVRMKR
jgi:hypothetical protein